MVDIPKSVAEALAEMAEEDEEEDVAQDEDADLDELYERLQAEPNPYFQMRTACKLILVASAQHHIAHFGQTFGNPGGELPAIVASFVTCPDPVAAGLRALLDRSIQQFFRATDSLTNKAHERAPLEIASSGCIPGKNEAAGAADARLCHILGPWAR
jgi:hypothetical protein